MDKIAIIQKRIYEEIEPFKPQFTVEETIVKINKIFHHFDAPLYDHSHPEIFLQLPKIYSEMVKIVMNEKKKLRILDFGCGTGFEAIEFLKNGNLNLIEEVVCYDLSEEMLIQCEKKIKSLFVNTNIKFKFTSNFDDVPRKHEFNVLLTNSLLHHLPEGFDMIENMKSYLSQDAYWIAGHEDSVRFLKNPECMRIYKEFLKYNNRKLWKLNKYPYYIKRAFEKLRGDQQSSYKKTAVVSVQEGVFLSVPPNAIIGKLIDVYVARNLDDAKAGMAFDFEEIQLKFQGEWKLSYLKTYGFMGGTYIDALNKKDKKRHNDLKEKYPNDGSNFCSVWKRV